MMTEDRDQQIEKLFQSVRDYYSTPTAIDTYTNYARTEGLHGPEMAMVERFMSPPADVLDIGCGAGREAFVLAKMGYSVTGVDITQPLLEQAKVMAKEFGLDIDFRQMDGRSLDFPDSSFDYVLLITQMIHHVPFRENRTNLLSEAGRVLTPGGKIILTYHDWEILKTHEPWGYGGFIDDKSKEITRQYTILEERDFFGNECQGDLTETYGYSHRFTHDEMEAEVAEAGLKIIDRADFYSITGEPLEFWKPTQIVIMTV